jgi:23S rRNA (cytosine1962-C5)-methyltransferase
MKYVDDFKDYKLIDLGNGMKLEKWGDITLYRPDPQVIWDKDIDLSNVDAIYHRSNKGGGSWEIKNKRIPDRWQVKYRDLTFNIKLMGFKHTGLFPEQAYNWNIIIDKIKSAKRSVKVLNLFAYTGAASVAALSAGAEVVHVDSSRGMVDWAKENVECSGLKDKPIRFLVDDCIKFVKREIRRGNKYDMIIMDPPSFGRGSNGEVWSLEKDLYELVQLCSQILSDKPIMFLINSYTTGISKTILEDVLLLTVNNKYEGVVTSDEIGIKCENGLLLPCGIFARWESKQ